MYPVRAARVLCALLCTAAAVFSGCPAASDSTTAYCGKRLIILKEAILHPATPVELFSAITPDAKNDCDAHYEFTLQWADAARATADSLLPPIADLANAFRPDGDSTGFVHPAIERMSMAGIWMWGLNFDANNKLSAAARTKYSVWVNVDPLLQHGPEDSVKVTCQIVYSPI